MFSDLRYAIRMLMKSPGFTAVSVLTLALGIGANTAIFSFVDAVLLKPLPYEQPGQLVQVWLAPTPGAQNSVSPGAFMDWNAQATVFESLSLRQTAEMNLTGSGEPERLSGMAMSASGLAILRAHPILGRTFAPDEDQPGKDKVVVLTHELWQRRFNGQSNIVEQTIQLDDQSYMVIGVLPPHFLPWEEAEFVVPTAVSLKDASERGANWLQVIGRLKPGVDVAEANAAMNALAARLRSLYPPERQNWGVNVVPMHEQLVGKVRPTLLVLLGAVGFVMLIACVNVANLLLARASSRQREMAIRAALGASRLRVIRLLLTESMVLSTIGAALGVALAYAGIGVLTRLAAENLPRAGAITLDLKLIGFALLVSLVSAALFGLVPALHASRTNLNEALRDGLRSTGSAARNRLRAILIISEVAISLVLLAGAGLLLKSFVRLSDVEPGINPRSALTLQLSLPKKKYPDAQRRSVFLNQVLERITNLPGVEAAGVIGSLPLVGGVSDTSFTVIGRAGQPEEGLDTDFDFCTPDYFRAIGIPLRAGRLFDLHDAPGQIRAVIINEAFARLHFPTENPIGKRLHLETFTRKVDGGWEIVGIVGDVHQRGLNIAPGPCVYRPQPFSFAGGNVNVVVRTAGAPLALAQNVRKAILEIDPNQPIANLRPMEEVVSASFAQRRFTLIVLGVFAGVALLLAAIGLYGVVAYAVSERVREIGIRMALGASRGNVLSLILGQGMKLVGLGVGIGFLGALGLTRALVGMLYEVKPGDPSVFAIVSLLLLLVALLASWLPAHRAAKVDPMVALRSE